MSCKAANALQAQNQQLEAQNQQLQAQAAGLQRKARFVEAGDMLFRCFHPGGYQLSTAAEAKLSNNIVPELTGLQNAKVVVHGYTDNEPVGLQLQRAGINDNLTLSSRHAGAVVSYLVSPASIQPSPRPRGLATRIRSPRRPKNRRSVITVQGPGAPSA